MGQEEKESFVLMLSVTVDVRNAEWKAVLRPHVKTVREACGAALKGGLGIRDSGSGRKKEYEITVVLADDAFIRKLNRDFRGQDKPTNVLSFPQSPIPNPQSPYLGDIVLSLSTLKREAKAQGKSLRYHALHLLVHGTLHLLGHDHMKDKDAAAMERREIKILKTLGVENPYLWQGAAPAKKKAAKKL